jgi:putative phosphoesterase
MRIALLADIHGNSVALNEVLRKITSSGCKVILIAGDLVGYYYNIKEVLEQLKHREIFFVRGNHESMLKEVLEVPAKIDSINKKYGSSLERSKDALTIEEISFLVDSPISKTLEIDGIKLSISHGTPWNENEYVYPDSSKDLFDKLIEVNADVIILGNTHHQMIRRLAGKIIINPGSVGQSRSDMGYAQWAELETETLDVVFRSTPYDTSTVFSQCSKYDPDNQLLRRFLTK